MMKGISEIQRSSIDSELHARGLRIIVICGSDIFKMMRLVFPSDKDILLHQLYLFNVLEYVRLHSSDRKENTTLYMLQT